ncbi:cellulase family glycosylhydrolase [Nocardiopsis lambiniae]|uniref:Cellulase family glycosylhydrolase n=1 Tax=Nocardiopsis lambiniae TaxID=3075539 RepID=A0ABU2M5Q4_9ACTN|nr:cellulase family glycosylhydrolase [Nocardiopsis sp. DSM 44743]MDT0327983.1 cellulase family glycosylhydrolase [Nocardiopsis sp. DSM 44743]
MKRLAVLAVLLLLPGLLAVLTRHDPGPTRYITDDRGRALFLHGFNTSGSAKGDPEHLPWITEDDVRTEYDLMGTNFVRFLVQWQALEPARGVYDEEYLDAVAERVDWYAERGHHVLLDMHQDLYGRHTSPEEHSGNGAPAWATHNDGLPVESRDMWELVYLEPGVMRSFDHFWNTTGAHPGLMDDYAAAWRHLAARFADHPAVIGYDLMNEPFGGSLQGPDFEAGPLAELYRRCLTRIREVDQDTWVFVEGQAVGVNWGFPSALPYLTDPRDGEPRIVYAPHAYPLPMDLGRSYEGDSRETVDTSIRIWSDSVRVTAERLEAPIVLGEFGLDMSGPGAGDYVRRMLEETESMATGRAYWSNDHDGWGPWADEDLTPGPLVEVMSRAYPRAVAGRPVEVSYDAAGFRLRFTERDGVSGPTEIHLPAHAFPDHELTVDAPAGWTSDWDEERRILYVDIPRHGAGTEYAITVVPA